MLLAGVHEGSARTERERVGRWQALAALGTQTQRRGLGRGVQRRMQRRGPGRGMQGRGPGRGMQGLRTLWCREGFGVGGLGSRFGARV